jgi:RecA-family ATPase
VDAASRLEELIANDKEIKMVFIDPLNAFLDGRSPTNARARQLLRPFFAICERHGICVVLVHHFTKAGHKDLIDLIGGSGGLPQAVGSIYALARVKDVGILQHLECNDLPTDGQCYEYAVEPVTLDQNKYKRRKKPTSRVVMLGKSPVDIQTALKLGKDVSGSCVPAAMHEIEQFLKPHGTMPSGSIVKHLEEKGITRATWKRAQDHLQKEGRLAYVRDGRTMSWRLIEPEPEPAREFKPQLSEREPAPSESSESHESESQSQSRPQPKSLDGSFEVWGGLDV